VAKVVEERVEIKVCIFKHRNWDSYIWIFTYDFFLYLYVYSTNI